MKSTRSKNLFIESSLRNHGLTTNYNSNICPCLVTFVVLSLLTPKVVVFRTPTIVHGYCPNLIVRFSTILTSRFENNSDGSYETNTSRLLIMSRRRGIVVKTMMSYSATETTIMNTWNLWLLSCPMAISTPVTRASSAAEGACLQFRYRWQAVLDNRTRISRIIPQQEML